ncbi:hypothetical protein L484_021821 [Morus notabilis]|uniref:Uncharacterized protein n=1 Tax=Morus notabilis TaxID=981085 RepID=W9QHX7_9ROSA|nr:hypothetical protein L484_021821 [Morus notabilis]
MAEEDFRAEADAEIGNGNGTHTHSHWRWWAAASAAQLGWGVASFKKGYAGHSNLMPLKAFAVASLFVGAAASASLSALHASGIHKKHKDHKEPIVVNSDDSLFGNFDSSLVYANQLSAIDLVLINYLK